MTLILLIFADLYTPLKNIYMPKHHLIHQDLTSEIINSFYEVYNRLGYGFLEKVYQNALVIELRGKGFSIDIQKKIEVRYKGFLVGNYSADLMIENLIILELKACENIIEEHERQLLNYLKATNCEVGLLLNFGKKPEFKRKVFSNKNKSE